MMDYEKLIDEWRQRAFPDGLRWCESKGGSLVTDRRLLLYLPHLVRNSPHCHCADRHLQSMMRLYHKAAQGATDWQPWTAGLPERCDGSDWNEDPFGQRCEICNGRGYACDPPPPWADLRDASCYMLGMLPDVYTGDVGQDDAVAIRWQHGHGLMSVPTGAE